MGPPTVLEAESLPPRTCTHSHFLSLPSIPQNRLASSSRRQARARLSTATSSPLARKMITERGLVLPLQGSTHHSPTHAFTHSVCLTRPHSLTHQLVSYFLPPKKQVRIQLQEAGKGAAVNRNPFTIGAQMIKNEGFFSLYRGLSAGLLRQATYTTARMGLFNKFMEMAKDEKVRMPLYFSIYLPLPLSQSPWR